MPPRSPFLDRQDAGRQLGAALVQRYGKETNAVVLGLARGGVPVAQQVAQALDTAWDVLIVRKLGFPGQPEFAMGAIASGGILVLDHDLVDELGVSHEAIEAVREQEQAELIRREQSYRRGRPALALVDKLVILVDDGLATGFTMRAAVAAVRQEGAKNIVVAAPVGSPQACAELQKQADEVVCLHTPEYFQAVGEWYQRFAQINDDEVLSLLKQA